MLRAILGVIIGYIVMIVIVMLGMAVAYMALGADGAFEPGVYRPSMLWIGIGLVIGIVAALAAGFVCRKIARSHTPAMVLAAVVAVVGVIIAIGMSQRPLPTDPRPPTITFQEAGERSVTPMWVGLVNTAIGAIGVLLGSRMAAKRP